MSTPAAVFDMGSIASKIGFAGDLVPRHVIPSIVGYPREEMRKTGMTAASVGQAALDKFRKLEIHYPIEYGFILNWEACNILWTELFAKLEVASSDQPLLITTPVVNTPASRDRIVSNLFDRYDLPALYLATQETMALYALGLKTGLVVDSGYGVTTITPIKDLKVIENASTRSAINGYVIVDQFMKRCTNKGFKVETWMPLRKMTESMVCVVQDYEAEMAKPEEYKHYDLLDSLVVEMGRERFQCGEAFFNPSIFEINEPGLHLKIHEAIRNVNDPALAAEMYANIVVAGSNTYYPGFIDRLKSELAKTAPPGTTINVIAPEDRNTLVFRGSSMFAAADTFPSEYISREEYDDAGTAILYRKCLV